MTILAVENIRKTFGGATAVSDVGFTMAAGEILCFLGASGCGKTTLLRIIAGLERADAGTIRFEGRDMAGVPPHRRSFGMMFQDFALFPHRNVIQNVTYGLALRKLPAGETERRAEEMLEMVGLAGFAERNVGELSGGERQRVALARSLAPHPRLLMLDEPLGSLDRALRERLMVELRRILKAVGVTAIFVTHDQAEAFAIADRIAVFSEAKIAQIAAPEVVYHRPASETVAKFLGFRNFLTGTVDAAGAVETAAGALYPDTTGLLPGQAVTLMLKPDTARVLLDGESVGEGETPVNAVVVERLFQGKSYRVGVALDSGDRFDFELGSRFSPPEVGRRIRLVLRPFGMVRMPAGAVGSG